MVGRGKDTRTSPQGPSSWPALKTSRRDGCADFTPDDVKTVAELAIAHIDLKPEHHQGLETAGHPDHPP